MADEQFTVVLLPVDGPPRPVASEGGVSGALEWLGHSAERAETIDRDNLYCSNSGVIDGLALNPMATLLVNSLAPGEFVAGPAFVVGQSETSRWDAYSRQWLRPRLPVRLPRATRAAGASVIHGRDEWKNRLC